MKTFHLNKKLLMVCYVRYSSHTRAEHTCFAPWLPMPACACTVYMPAKGYW